MDDECELSIELHNSVLLQSVRWIQIFVSVCSISLVLYIYIRHLNRTIMDRLSIWFAKTAFINTIAYSFGIGVVQVAHVVARLTAATPCGAQIPKILCLFRMMAASVSLAFVLIHVSITIKQALATFRYPLKVQNIVARLCIVLTYCYAVFYGYFVFRNESLSGRTQLCSSFTDNSEIFIIIHLNLMMALDFVNIIVSVFLVTHNRKILKNERNSFDLSRTFPWMQNLYAIEPFIPILALHSVPSFSLYYRRNYTNAEFAIVHAAVNLVPYYCLIAPLAFLILIKHGQTSADMVYEHRFRLGRFRRQGHMRNMIAPMPHSNTQELYFHNLKESWNTHQ